MSYLGNSPANALYNVTPAVRLSAGQTIVPIVYTVGRCLFLLNGAVLALDDDILATNGSTATLTTGANDGDVLVAINFASFNVANAVPLSGGPMGGPLQLAGGDTIAGTPAQFDNSSKLVNTSFVQRALGNFQTAIPVATALTLTAANAGSFYSLNPGSSATLPLYSTLAFGATFTFFNASTSNLTVSAQGSDQIYAPINGSFTGSATSISLAPGDLVVITATSAQYEVVGGPQAAAVAGGRMAASLGSNGYQKLPSGLIVQWRYDANSVPANQQSTFNPAWPIAFPNACSACFPVLGACSSANTGVFMSLANYSKTVAGYYLNSTSAQTIGVSVLGIGY